MTTKYKDLNINTSHYNQTRYNNLVCYTSGALLPSLTGFQYQIRSIKGFILLKGEPAQQDYDENEILVRIMIVLPNSTQTWGNVLASIMGGTNTANLTLPGDRTKFSVLYDKLVPINTKRGSSTVIDIDLSISSGYTQVNNNAQPYIIIFDDSMPTFVGSVQYFKRASVSYHGYITTGYFSM